jgi:UDPglucose 6-dehydrogenase
MIQDVAERNGNMNVDVVTRALSNSTHRIMSKRYMTAGLGDAGACHPRDNIALRYMSDKLGLGYDLFDAIMLAREIQAENMAKKCLEYGKNVVIIGKAYKPSVPYTNGSASMLVGHYIEKHGGTVRYYDENTGDTDLDVEWAQVYLIGYWEDYVRAVLNKVPTHCVVIDPWRKADTTYTHSEIVHYGDTRKKKVRD